MLRYRSIKLSAVPTAGVNRSVASSKNASKTTSPRHVIRSFSTAPTKVPVELVKELRERTLAGYSDCKNALIAENLDIEKAIQWLRKKGALKAAAKAGRVAAEGLVGIGVNSARSNSAIIEVNSETDFVSRGDTFSNLTRSIVESILQHNKPIFTQATLNQKLDVESIKNLTVVNGQSVLASITDAVGKLQENIQLRRASVLAVQEGKGVVGAYIHREQGATANGISLGHMGALVALECNIADQKTADEVISLANKLAMHIVGYNPKFVTKEQITKEVLKQLEEEFLKKQELDLHVDPNSRPKFNPNKASDEITLYEQEYTLNTNKKVHHIINEFSKKIGQPVRVSDFIKFQTGEGIEKKEEDFASEVQKIVQGQ